MPLAARRQVCALVGALLVAGLCGACVTDDRVDTGDPNVEQLVFQYDEGDVPEAAWRALWNAGARECAADDTLVSVRFRIDDLPESPRPDGWADADISGQRTCEELIAGFPF